MLALFDFEYKFIFIETMNTQTIPHYIDSHEETDSIEVRQQSFTFSKFNQHHNPQSTPQKHINEMEKNIKVQAETAEKEESDHHHSQRKANRSIQHQKKQDLKDQKQPTSLTPGHRSKGLNEHEKEGEHSEDSEGQGKDYNGLTMKLETALKKISNSKGMNKTIGQPETVWRRFQECEQRKKKDLEVKKQQNEKMRSKHYKDKPTINKHSERLAREVGYEPIYTRFQKLMEIKKKKEEDLEEAKKREKQIQEELFKEELNRHMKKPQHLRTYDNYYEEMVAWKEKKDKINREKLEQQQVKEMSEVTFKPTLNSKSKKMVSSHNRLPIQQRGLLKKKPTTQQYSFTPNLGKKNTR